MKAPVRILLLLVVTAAMPPSFAAVAVDSVNFPVWLERDSRSRALAPGASLVAGDVIRTGARGRAWLAFDDGSVVKLGSNARFEIESAEIRDADGGSLMQAAFDLLRGAFRFTSGFFAPRRQAGHRVDMKVGAITVGIRGTDIWGRSGEDRDFVALLEGRIEVGSGDGDAQVLEQPLTLYAKPKGQPAEPVQAVELAAVAALAPETELDAAAGIASTGGDHALVLMSLRDAQLVDGNLERFRRAGYPVSALRIDLDGQPTTRIRLTGLQDRAAAAALAPRLSAQFGLVGIWITRE